MSRPHIEAFAVDDRVIEKLWAHDLTAAQIQQMLESTFVLLRNRRERRGLYLMIGRDRGGMLIAAAITSTQTKGIWRVLTAWPAKRSEATIYKRRAT